MTGAGDRVTATIEAFNDAFNAGDVAALAGLVSDDCVFDGTPAPDGERHTGRDAVLAAFAAVFAGAADASFTTEELFTAGDRAVVRWRYEWVDHDGRPGHVRGVDLFRVVGDRVAEKLSYVKG
jgi:ketosteroid isomerase-like protein